MASWSSTSDKKTLPGVTSPDQVHHVRPSTRTRAAGIGSTSSARSGYTPCGPSAGPSGRYPSASADSINSARRSSPITLPPARSGALAQGVGVLPTPSTRRRPAYDSPRNCSPPSDAGSPRAKPGRMSRRATATTASRGAARAPVTSSAIRGLRKMSEECTCSTNGDGFWPRASAGPPVAGSRLRIRHDDDCSSPRYKSAGLPNHEGPGEANRYQPAGINFGGGELSSGRAGTDVYGLRQRVPATPKRGASSRRGPLRPRAENDRAGAAAKRSPARGCSDGRSR